MGGCAWTDGRREDAGGLNPGCNQVPGTNTKHREPRPLPRLLFLKAQGRSGTTSHYRLWNPNAAHCFSRSSALVFMRGACRRHSQVQSTAPVCGRPPLLAGFSRLSHRDTELPNQRHREHFTSIRMYQLELVWRPVVRHGTGPCPRANFSSLTLLCLYVVRSCPGASSLSGQGSHLISRMDPLESPPRI